MTETTAIIILSSIVAVLVLALCSLPFLLWRFIDQRDELRRLREDLDQLDQVVERLGGGLGLDRIPKETL